MRAEIGSNLDFLHHRHLEIMAEERSLKIDKAGFEAAKVRCSLFFFFFIYACATIFAPLSTTSWVYFSQYQAESIEISKSGKRVTSEGIELDVHGLEKLKAEGVPATDDR